MQRVKLASCFGITAVLLDGLHPHIVCADACHCDRVLHCVAAERLAQFLVDHCFDQRGLAVFHLVFNSRMQRRCQFVHRAGLHTLQAAGLRDTSIGDFVIQLGADEVILVPKGGITLFGAPLIIAEDDHRNSGPFFAADCGQLCHGDAERAVACKTDNRNIRTTNFCADN